MPTHIPTPEAMRAHGSAFAGQVADGAVIALVGDLGAGKTHWTQGFVAGLGSDAKVTSPTFGLVHEYPGGRLPVFHFDFHRIDSPDELLAIDWDDYLDRPGVIVAEWADKFLEMMPPDAIWIHIEHHPHGGRGILEHPPRKASTSHADEM
ncbi:MAG: tRNA (adenosine(37)-N6)-threonylcarbamoyltransferase complex ATPase subunit type 1 TsaE [Luteolibacter sp.]|jgi:tRNA threonylcarbamoyladenosine biosynthesis protein TsaE